MDRTLDLAGNEVVLLLGLDDRPGVRLVQDAIGLAVRCSILIEEERWATESGGVGM